MPEDELAEWHHRCNGHELGQTPGDGEGQGSLVCCSPWGCKESEMTWRLNNDNPLQGSLSHWTARDVPTIMALKPREVK